MSEPTSPADVESKLWKEIHDSRFGMLGLTGQALGASRHFQPMTVFPEPDHRRIWFFTRTDTDLAQDVGAGHAAMFVIQSKDRQLQACIAGDLRPDRDTLRIEKYWSPLVAAWFPEGKTDPKLTLLCFNAADAQVWISAANPVKFAWEIAKANLTGDMPDIGSKTSLNLG